MTDAEMFVRLRDIMQARTGSWSAAGVLELAQLLGFRARRSVAFRAIKDACGTGNKRPGPGGQFGSRCVEQFGSGNRSNSVPSSVPEKERKKQRKKESFIPPSGTSYPPDPQEFGDLEADVSCFVALAAEENPSGKITPARVLSLRTALYGLMQSLADRAAFAYGLRAATTAGAPNLNYVKKAAFGSRGVVKSVCDGSIRFGSRCVEQEPTEGQLRLAAEFEEIMQNGRG